MVQHRDPGADTIPGEQQSCAGATEQNQGRLAESLDQSMQLCGSIVPEKHAAAAQMDPFLPRPHCASIVGQTDRFHDER